MTSRTLKLLKIFCIAKSDNPFQKEGGGTKSTNVLIHIHYIIIQLTRPLWDFSVSDASSITLMLLTEPAVFILIYNNCDILS